MSIAAGSRLGPYEILLPLGAGGMGEVYRARDSRLGRDVAIKVLPEALASDPERLKRFEKEARSASALNHPNIVTVYDIGSQDGVSYLAMELVSGETLRTLVSGGPMPIKKLLAIAPQIAEGLAKAHEAGIVHRDLKPENVMVTKDGLVKILDFGLAKLTSTMSASDEGSNLPTMTGTTPGVVVGTVGYMSPEQASGAMVDFRSDQFSFGSILYEMATGKRAFQKKTAIDTLGAILNEEPEAIASISPQTPAPLRWIAERCLSKEPRQRYSATDDLARDLVTLREHVSESVSGGAVAVERPRALMGRRLWPLGSALLLAALGIAAERWWASRHPNLSVPALKQLTFRRGNILSARFAPDGRTVVYGAAWDDRPVEIYTVRTDSTESRPIGVTRAMPLAVSSKGELAVLLKKDNDLWGGKGTLARVPLGGGTPRELLEDVWNADWAPNGEDLAVIKDSNDGGKEIQYPIGMVLARAPDFTAQCRVSPDGERVATMLGRDLVIFDRKGRRVVLSRGWLQVNEWAWSPAGDAIIFLGTRMEGTSAVYSVSLSGRERVLVSNMASFGCLYDLAADGRLLLEQDYNPTGISIRARGQNAEREWLPSPYAVAMSADGSRALLVDGHLRATDGSPPLKLGDGTAADLSADGRWALMIQEGPPKKLVLVPTGPGTSRQIPLGGVEPQSAEFLPTGGFLVVSAGSGGAAWSIGTVGPDGGNLKRLPASDRIRENYWGGITTPVSPGGDLIAYVNKEGRIQIDPLAGGSGSMVPGITLGKTEALIQWSEDGRYLYVPRSGEVPMSVDRVEIATGRREGWKKLAPEDRAGFTMIGGLWISRDGESYAYVYPRVLGSDLYTMSGVR